MPGATCLSPYSPVLNKRTLGLSQLAWQVRPLSQGPGVSTLTGICCLGSKGIWRRDALGQRGIPGALCQPL